MIESIQFKNFKALRDTTLPLGACTILVGPNGSGKSTVLQALEATSHKQQLKFEDIVSIGSGVDEQAKVEVRLIWGQPHVGVESIVRWEASGRQTEGRDDHAGGHDVNLIRSLIAAMRVYSLDAHAITEPVHVAQKMELARNGAGLAGVLSRLQDRDPERFEALSKEVARWLPEFDRVRLDVDGQNRRTLGLRTREGRHAIPASDLSQGTLIALAILTLAYLPNPPSLVGLEEPDRGLHPYLLRRVQDAIYRLTHPESCGETREPVQVIATTHNPYFLDLFKDHPEEIVVANKVGSDVQFERVTDRPHFKDILGDAPLGEAWFTGFLGGVPSGS